MISLLVRLKILILWSNHFHGVIEEHEPARFLKLQIILNNKGLELEYLKIPDALAVIDFSHNGFEGKIPDVIGDIIGLHLLNLSSNMLSGNLPSSLANLKELECLDISVNHLSGVIPPQLAEITFLSSFNVVYNQKRKIIEKGSADMHISRSTSSKHPLSNWSLQIDVLLWLY